MSLTTLKDDLLAEFREERVMINEQIVLLDPLATCLRKPAAQRLLSSSTLVISEYIAYVVSLGGIAFMALMHRIYPFSILNRALYTPDQRNRIGGPNLVYLALGIYGLVAIGVILTFVLARVVREVRLKNEILYMAGKDIKTIVGQHLERKAALDTIEQRHMLGMSGINHPERLRPATAPATTPFQAAPVIGINEVQNPGFN